MPIDISSERIVSLTEAAQVAPGRPHLATVWRWALHGCRGVKLETIVSGGRRYTSHEAIGRFVAATTAVAAGQPAPKRTRAERAKAARRADAILARAGI